MLTIDDCNSLIEKYGDIGFWYEVDFSQFEFVKGKTYRQDFCDITLTTTFGQDYFDIIINTDLFKGQYYCKDLEGNIIGRGITRQGKYSYDMYTTGMDNNFILALYLTNNPVNEYTESSATTPTGYVLPVSSLLIPVCNGEYEDKFYIQKNGDTSVRVTINGEVVPTYTDDNGIYIVLSSATDCVLGYNNMGFVTNCFNIKFKKFKSLPKLSIAKLYRGTRQEVSLRRDPPHLIITDFQAYYKGELLKDNIIDAPTTGNYLDITVDLFDKNYPESTVKLKAPLELRECSTATEIRNAINKGISYIRIDTGSSVIDGITFNNMTLILRRFYFKNCTFNNCDIRMQLENRRDYGGNVFNNCTIQSSFPTTRRNLYSMEGVSQFNNCRISKIHFIDYEVHITGTINNCSFRNSLIISDGDIEITDSLFTIKQQKPYFPAYLYLTGEYIVKGNEFRLTDTFEELAFNMCLIKATSDFNVSEFIQQNNFELNITYDDEPTNTLYYNIVDDDKIRARRV